MIADYHYVQDIISRFMFSKSFRDNIHQEIGINMISRVFKNFC